MEDDGRMCDGALPYGERQGASGAKTPGEGVPGDGTAGRSWAGHERPARQGAAPLSSAHAGPGRGVSGHGPTGCGGARDVCRGRSGDAPLMQGIGEGVRRAFPIVLGYVPVGFAFGVLALKSGIPAWGALAMSLFVFAGSGQLIAVGLIGGGAPLASVVLTTFVVNLRHLLMSAALAPRLRDWGLLRQALFSAEMTDETFAVHVSTLRGEADDPSRAAVFACNVTAHAAWVGGSALGVFCSTLVADVRPLGLDYALAAMFIALLLPQCRSRAHLFAALVAGACSVGFALSGAGRWNVMLATVCAATLVSLLPVGKTSTTREEMGTPGGEGGAHAD